MTTHTSGTRTDWRAAAALGTADWVCLAAAPTFAIMALLAGGLGGGADMLCSATQNASPLNGMVWMYMRMPASIWALGLSLISSRRRGAARGRPGVRKMNPTPPRCPEARPEFSREWVPRHDHGKADFVVHLNPATLVTPTVR